MATEDMDDRYFIYENRLASFQGPQPVAKRRGSNAHSRAPKALQWPHKNLAASDLVEAGWKYTPTMDSDDNTTCTYCQLALDGWEAGDKPMDEHYKRSPNCPFFGLINSNPAPKKAGRSKAARSSKASRLSIQSVATAMSDITSIADLPADADDSILTTTSTMTQGGKKAKGRKPAAAKGRKTRAKKDETVEIHEDEQVDEVEKPQPPAKASRGRKRTSDEVEQSILTNVEAPAPKRRNTKARGSNAGDTSVLTVDNHHDVEMVDAPAPTKKSAGRKKATATKGRPRKASAASIASTASTASLRGRLPNDDELDRQLEADLDRPLSDDEDILADSDSERRNAQLATKMKGKKVTIGKSAKQGQTESTDFAMFDPAPADPDDAAVDAELKMLEAEMAVEDEVETLKVPKKGRKAGTRKVSKQTKKAKVPAPPSEPDELEEPAPAPKLPRKSNDVETQDVGTANTDTTVKKKRGRPSKKSTSSQAEVDQPTTSANSKRIALAPMPVAATPMRNGSPSKRQNVIGGLQTTAPWTAVDLDLVFENKENAHGASAERFFSQGGDLSSPEKRMTVEEWIYYNAGQAEQKLKHECETMVTAFEKEGTRAMQALEGLVVE
ncbi:putative at hook domain-containing protein [Phaeoacremonium minimum UCRPA7]|uniref:Putative at hook domain-containing protein n=1 Tax=Phaeoacremonium minimum (strain UCR-PA7) TaxID=1286976 RepID=R8BP56_PHAM7|nr:putative at hook domain-containing protein [Phaeoacremonium minimum UCRPA7]EOO01117.1 putative at hook domain-containing protein [Phaeoacremonium minimum UCRPA7]